MDIFILAPIILPFLLAIIGALVKFKSERTRNLFIVAAVILNLIAVITSERHNFKKGK